MVPELLAPVTERTTKAITKVQTSAMATNPENVENVIAEFMSNPQ
jgi:hypothetical protein